jgi:hypothetical protein
MKLKLFFIIFILFHINSDLCAQVKLDPNNPNAKHDEVLRLTDLSNDVNLPIYIIDELKHYAKSINVHEKLVIRYDYIFKAMINEKLSKEERVFVCDYFLNTCKDCIQGYPITLISDIKKSLILKNK